MPMNIFDGRLRGGGSAPAQALSRVDLNIIRKWPDGFQERLAHVLKDVEGFIPSVQLYDIQRVLAEYGFEMIVLERKQDGSQ